MKELRFGGVYALPEGVDELDEEDDISVEFITNDEDESVIAFVWKTSSTQEFEEYAQSTYLENGEELRRVEPTALKDLLAPDADGVSLLKDFAARNSLVCMATPTWYSTV